MKIILQTHATGKRKIQQGEENKMKHNTTTNCKNTAS